MALARLIVIEGPDRGTEFEIPLRGGGIGRGEGNVVQLTDLSVSRHHCSIELREGQLTLVDHGSRNRSLVNGEPVSQHVLASGDEIAIGKTLLRFLPSESTGKITREKLPSRVTMEAGSGELLRAETTALGPLQLLGGDGRARRHLAFLAGLGEPFRGAADRNELASDACRSALGALAAGRAFILFRDAAGRMVPAAAALAPESRESTQLELPAAVIDKVMREQKAVALEVGDTRTGTRAAVAAPLIEAARSGPSGLIYADRSADSPWDQVDLMAVGCLAHLIGSALGGLAARTVLVRENRELERQLGGREFIGDSGPAQAVLAFVAKVGPSTATVLLTGESGSGKEMVARAVHRASLRSAGPFVAINCAALTESLIESELFGHEKGAFTGAAERKLGRFELADKGTLFLDEVGELPLNCQTKFLRVLEEQCFERVGGGRSITVDVRVVAATNRDLSDMVRRGQFRDDLFYRLSVIHQVVPPLRERREDIPQLAEYFLARLRTQVPRRIIGFAEEALRVLMAHAWPGNVRELKNAIERAIVLGEGDRIRAQDLPPNITGDTGYITPPTAPFARPITPLEQAAPSAAAAAIPVTTAPPVIQARPLRELERAGIVAALAATGGNKAQAAQLLEIDRSTLYKKIKDYGIAT